MKIILNENQFQLLIEHEFNYHYGKNHDLRPYVSDNKYRMSGRETGHFGSGTYFSTYPYDKNIPINHDSTPNFIQIKNNLYRVDFDLYKNLYRVRSKKQGDILYTLLKNVNALFNCINVNGRFYSKSANYDNSNIYQKIMINSNALNLKCPTYYNLIRMAQSLGSDENVTKSFSTLFMEYNGYNGVNVSGIDFYDNTTHGSVIYDLSKVEGSFEEVNPRNLFSGFKHSPYNDTLVKDGDNEFISDSLHGEYFSWIHNINDMSITDGMRLLKNYTKSGNILNTYYIEDLDDELKKKYLRFLYVKNPFDRYGNRLCDNFVNYDNKNRFIKIIEEHKLYYWVNYENKYCSILVGLLNNFSLNLDWDLDINEENNLKEEYLKKLIGYMNRELNEYEIDFIENDFYIK